VRGAPEEDSQSHSGPRAFKQSAVLTHDEQAWGTPVASVHRLGVYRSLTLPLDEVHSSFRDPDAHATSLRGNESLPSPPSPERRGGQGVGTSTLAVHRLRLPVHPETVSVRPVRLPLHARSASVHLDKVSVRVKKTPVRVDTVSV